jgi:chromosomal replication initiator protein
MKITIEQIQIAVAEFFNLPLEEITLHCRKRVIALPRPIAMFLAKQFTDASVAEITRQFSCKSRSSIARIAEQRRTDVALERVLRQISETLKPTYEALRIVSADKNSYGADQRGH